jgi:hypothetical protein
MCLRRGEESAYAETADCRAVDRGIAEVAATQEKASQPSHKGDCRA